MSKKISGALFEDTIIRLIQENTSSSNQKDPNFTFFTHILMNCRKVFTDKVKVLSSKVDDKVTLFINEDGLSQLSLGERKQKIVHELLHIISLHHSRARSADNFNLFSMATDLAISHYTEELKDLPRVSDFNGEQEKLPDNVVSLSRFKQQKEVGEKLQENEVVEYYYEFLKEYHQNNPENFSMNMPQSGQGEGQQQEGQQGQGEGSEGEEKEGEGSSTPSGSGANRPQMEMKVGGKTIKEDTDQQMWKESTDNEELAKSVVKDIVSKAMDKMRARGAGTVTNDLDMLLNDLYKSEVNWKQKLRVFVTRKARAGIKRTRKKLNRRTGLLNLGKKKENELFLVVIRDVSGSCMSDDIQGQFYAEIDKLHKSGIKIKLIDADTEVKTIADYDPKKARQIVGFGGTAYNQPLQVAETLGADGILYFGDMDCADTPDRIKTPVLWVTTGQNPPVEWGHRVTITPKKR